MKYGVNTTASNTSGNTIDENAITNVATANTLLAAADVVQPQEISG